MTLRETLERVRSMTLPGNEEAAKFKIIMPILRDLGWDDTSDEVILEYSVGSTGRRRKSSGGGGRVDIALAPDPRRPVALIEAKAPGQDLSDHVSQVLNYAFHDGVSICVLTNGAHWWLYLPLQKGPPEDRKFAALDLLEGSLEAIADDLQTFLGQEALISASAEKRASQVLKARRETDLLNEKLPGLWRAMLGQAGSARPDDELVELVSKRAYDKLNLRPAPQQIVDVIQDRPVSPMPTAEAKPSAMAERDVRAASPAGTPKKRKKRQPSTKPTGFVLWGHRRSVEHFSEIVTGVAEAIHDRHPRDFHRIGQLRGKKWPYASQRPVELYTAKQVGTTGWHVDVHMGGPDTIRRAKQFLAHFGYDPDDLEVLYDSGASTPPEPAAPPQRSTRRPRRSKPAWTPKQGKPTGFELWGRHYPVHSFNDIPVGVAEAIHDRHRHDFQRIGELRGRKWPYASRNPDELHQAKQVGTTGWHIDVHFSGQNAIKRARLFLEHFGHDPDDLKLLYD